jgi:hypothetical protein
MPSSPSVCYVKGNSVNTEFKTNSDHNLTKYIFPSDTDKSEKLKLEENNSHNQP